jgi:hypothetical protein
MNESMNKVRVIVRAAPKFVDDVTALYERLQLRITVDAYESTLKHTRHTKQ